MDERWAAPGKINLSLRVGRPRSDGYHPLESLVQAIDWYDDLAFTDADEDRLEISGADLPVDGENLVWRAVEALGVEGRSPVRIDLTKRIPIGAGLGGGSSDAACVIAALGERHRIGVDAQVGAAISVGADVTFFLTGGTVRMEGIGDQIEGLVPLSGFVLVVLVPSFGLSTPAVYQAWDRRGYPRSSAVEPGRLPPVLRGFEITNDLTPAAIDLEPALGDLIVELADVWERPVMMSGSGSAVFGCFADVDEAAGAARAAEDLGRTRVCGLESGGVRRTER